MCAFPLFGTCAIASQIQHLVVFWVFHNVKVILEASGSSWDKLVDVTVFLTNMKDDFHVYNKIYSEYFNENQPCRTTVEVGSLPTPIAIELKCIATMP